MYPVAVVGEDATAKAAILACEKAGFSEVRWFSTAEKRTHTLNSTNESGTDQLGTHNPESDLGTHNPESDLGPESELESGVGTYPALTLGANLSRIVQALVGPERLLECAHIPNREQVRFAQSGYLLSELPLGTFVEDRYRAPHLNISYTALLELLEVSQTPVAAADLREVEADHGIVLLTQGSHAEGNHLANQNEDTHALNASAAQNKNSHELWHATLPFDADMAQANITWLNGTQTGWQFADKTAMHYFWASPIGQSLATNDWHPRLHEALSCKRRLGAFAPNLTQQPQYLQAGHNAYLGDSIYHANIYMKEAIALGLEDAWVISRMMENYEEDIADGLSEYQKYRAPRVRKVMHHLQTTANHLGTPNPTRRLMRNINQAFSTRFLPEIAMQRIDWLYQYDCIRGFR